MNKKSVKNPNRYKLTISVRDERDMLPERPTGMDYHHIISHSQLRAFWNKIVEFNIEQLGETLLPKLRTVMGKYPLVRPDAASVLKVRNYLDSFCHNICVGQWIHDPNKDAVGPPEVPHMMESLKAVYLWMPGNLFIGPKRADDPEHRFESFASRVVEGNRYITILRAQQAIGLYMSQGTTYTANRVGTQARAQTAKLAHAAGLALAQVANYTNLPVHDPAVWAKAGAMAKIPEQKKDVKK